MRSHTFAVTIGVLAIASAAGAQTPDPRVGLRAGWLDAGEATRNLQVVARQPRPQGFVNPASAGDFGFVNSDLAFSGNYVFQGSFHGFQVWDVSNPARP